MDAKALGASVTRYNETARRREEARGEREWRQTQIVRQTARERDRKVATMRSDYERRA